MMTRIYVTQSAAAADDGREQWTAYCWNDLEVLEDARHLSGVSAGALLAQNTRRIQLASGTRAECVAAAEQYAAEHPGSWVDAREPRWPIREA